MNPISYFRRHPRRLGFIAFNLIAIALFVTGWNTLANPTDPALGDLPNAMLIYVGMIFLAIAWLASWGAWAVMVLSRRRRHAAGPTP